MDEVNDFPARRAPLLTSSEARAAAESTFCRESAGNRLQNVDWSARLP
jgi:hypothetical protein